MKCKSLVILLGVLIGVLPNYVLGSDDSPEAVGDVQPATRVVVIPLDLGGQKSIDCSECDGYFAPEPHDHHDWYFTKPELSTSGGGGQVHWDNLTNKPSGLDDGDDDTTYSADGLGVELSSTTFSVELDGATLTKSAAGLKVTDSTFAPVSHLHDERYYTETELQSSGSASVHWNNLTNVPSGLDDGDDNTTYSPGLGLNLVGTEFSVNTSTIQARVSSSCTAGSSIRQVNADGTVVCETDDDTTDHGSLSGLGDDDHPQYFHLSQNETVDGRPAFNGGISGSASPFSVDSTYLVANLNADMVDGLEANAFWNLSGNAGVITGTHFLGTTDNKVLDFRVNNARALRLEPHATSPNLIGGHSDNSVSAGVYGATISGGGETGYGHTASGNYATVGGGIVNTASGYSATVGGGFLNTASAYSATVSGGFDNDASGGSATVGGGDSNAASGNRATVGGGESNAASGDLATVGGGWENTASVQYATVGGGAANTASGNYATVGGGIVNTASDAYATVGGGFDNDASGGSATVGGGDQNTAGAYSATVGGGLLNTASNGFATVGGGDSNAASGNYATVGGGASNAASGASATVGGGLLNSASNGYATVGGGASNAASGGSATVGGGDSNAASGASATVGGGASNAASGGLATVGGGASNAASGASATVGGGVFNTASGDYATVGGGRRALASHHGEMAYASGRFANDGDAQTSLYVLRNTTSDATQTELFLDGSSQRITIGSNRVMTFDILVVATQPSGGGNSAGYQIRGVIERIGDATGFVGGTPTPTVLGEDDSDWAVSVIADDTEEALLIKVTGKAATDIRWVASVRTVEVEG